MIDSIESPRWLLLIHQIPPKPDYARVKVRRRLQGIGAVPLKRTVYALPASDQSREDFEWLAREIVELGGEATICEGSFLEPATGTRLIAAQRAERSREYGAIAASAQRESGDVDRLKRRLALVSGVDHFEAQGRADAEAAIMALEQRKAGTGDAVSREGSMQRRTWVTRVGVHVDRISSAWLIRRFIDPDARFRFVPPKGYRPEPGELRFDMFEGEFTHDGDRCTFETLCRHFALQDRALGVIAELVHDVDCKDDKFGRPETPGFRLIIDGIVRAHDADETRLERGAAILDDLYTQLSGARA
ncbi:MAG TPA: chromate resistance protein ChrB domain-containing protein [Gemmatimonadales bacterium]|nr:chromate resistance protein ChrB domain-containing protein [Gemmatimonadales bacterium]